jgi:hypothetical protein
MRKAKAAKASRKKKARRGARRAVAIAPAAAGAAPGRQLPPRGERESVEDPLEDWSEDDDRWVLERDAEDLQRERE